MTALVALASLAVAAVAAAAVMRPFRGGPEPAVAAPPDPLEDERRVLLRSLKDLDDEHLSGSIPEEDYRSLRHDTEVRAVAVLRALRSRDPQLAGFRELRVASANGQPGRGRLGRALPVIVVVAAVAAVSVPLLSGALVDRSPGQAITGDEAANPTSLAFFQNRVRAHPTDVAARLDLASRYQTAGDVTDATTQYLAALRLNPDNAEANAAVATLLLLSGHPKAALRHADRSLAPDPSYPEGLWVKGLILTRGLHHQAEAIAALRAYLAAAPYGSHRDQALRLLDRLSGSS